MHGQNLGNVRYNYRWRRKSTARDPFQYFSTKPNLPRKDSRLNIGPKALRVRNMGSTYWDTEAYCIHFTWPPKIRKWHNLLTYRYNQLDKAIEMLKKTLASRMERPSINGYTMNGENVITNGKLPTKKFTEMAPLLFYSITTVSRATTHISLKRIGSFIELRASGIKANLSKDKINMLFLGLRDPMNTKQYQQ
jgi:hypothetical protein